MSVIFDAMLIFELPDPDGMRDLNLLLHIADPERRQTFNEIDMDGAGGSKFFTTDVWAAAFNHFTPADVEDCICAANWCHPQFVHYVRELGDYVYDEDVSITMRTVAQLRAKRAEEEATDAAS